MEKRKKKTPFTNQAMLRCWLDWSNGIKKKRATTQVCWLSQKMDFLAVERLKMEIFLYSVAGIMHAANGETNADTTTMMACIKAPQRQGDDFGRSAVVLSRING